MLWWLYEFVFWIAVVLASPHYLLRMRRRGGYARGFAERFGRYHADKLNRLKSFQHPIWIHGVSVGEINLALEFISELQNKSPDINIILSTTTSTGHALALQRSPSNTCVIYYPLDSRFCFNRIHQITKVKALILFEAELWPNHLRFCKERSIALLLINARISKRFYPRYEKFKRVFAAGFNGFKLITTQTSSDGDLLRKLGFPAPSIVEVGSLKYDYNPDRQSEKRSKFLSDFSFIKNRPLIIGGSTHSGEEEVLLKIFIQLRKTIPDLMLGLAPRHVERSPEIIGLLKMSGCDFIKRTDLQPGMECPAGVILLNTTGELRYFYELATIIFIGKSLIGKGGQNIIEPGSLGKPILFGPHMENFEVISNDFLKANAAIQIQSSDELTREIEHLLTDEMSRLRLSSNALKLIESKRGGMERTVTLVAPLIR